MSRYEALTKLNILIRGRNQSITLINNNDGEEARLNRRSIGKLLSNPAALKSERNRFAKEQHYAVASDIIYLFRDSVKLLERPDKNGSPDVFIHRFGVPLRFNDAIAFITVKESRQHGKRIYSMELMKIERLGGALEEAGETPLLTSPAPSLQSGGITSPRLYNDNIHKLRAAVNTLSKKSYFFNIS